MKRYNIKLQIQYYIKMRDIKLKIWKNLYIKRNTFYTERNTFEILKEILMINWQKCTDICRIWLAATSCLS